MELSSQETCFLWGPRQTGKSTLLKSLFPNAIKYDLLLSAQYQQLLQDPGLIREYCSGAGLDGNNQTEPVIIDEIQPDTRRISLGITDAKDEEDWQSFSEDSGQSLGSLGEQLKRALENNNS